MKTDLTAAQTLSAMDAEEFLDLLAGRLDEDRKVDYTVKSCREDACNERVHRGDAGRCVKHARAHRAAAERERAARNTSKKKGLRISA